MLVAPPVERRVAQPIRPADTQHVSRIDADPQTEEFGLDSRDRLRRAGDAVPVSEMQGMYYLG